MSRWQCILLVCSICSVLFTLLFLLGNYYSGTTSNGTIVVATHNVPSNNTIQENISNKEVFDISNKVVPLYSSNSISLKKETSILNTVKKALPVKSTEFLDSTIEEKTEDAIIRKKYTVKNNNKYLLFFVLDDAGVSIEQVEPYINFVGKVTFAILPFLKHTTLVVDILQQNNIPYILHMPMQPIGSEDPGNYALKVSYNANRVSELIHRNLQSVAGSIGFNNHMGSLATSDKKLMYTVLKVAKQKNIFFLDSRTSATTVAEEVAQDLGMNIIVRDIFIDNDNNVEYIKKQIKKGMTLAKQKGFAVLIGHATKINTFTAISTMYPLIKKDGGELAGLDTFFHYIQISDAID